MSKFEKRKCSKGYGLFATEKILKGEIIYQEEHFLAVPDLDPSNSEQTKNEICAHCFLFILSFRNELSQEINQLPKEIPFETRFDNSTLKITPCLQNCGDKYCSEICRDLAWNKYHQILCKKSQEFQTKELEDYLVYAMDSEDYLLLGLKVICFMLIQIQNSQTTNIETAFEFFQQFHKIPWFSEDYDTKDFEFKEKNNILDRSYKLLMEMLKSWKSDKFQIFSKGLDIDFWNYLLGMLQCNSIEIITNSQVSKYLQFLRSLPRSQRDEIAATLTNSLPKIFNIKTKKIEGIGFFPTFSFLNHDCNPTAFVDTVETYPLISTLCAITDIEKDEEITISYFDQTLSITERQEHLLQVYRFNCSC